MQSFPFIVNKSVQEKAFTLTEIHYKRTSYENSAANFCSSQNWTKKYQRGDFNIKKRKNFNSRHCKKYIYFLFLNEYFFSDFAAFSNSVLLIIFSA
jgi:hypothetical protein